MESKDQIQAAVHHLTVMDITILKCICELVWQAGLVRLPERRILSIFADAGVSGWECMSTIASLGKWGLLQRSIDENSCEPYIIITRQGFESYSALFPQNPLG